MLISFVFYTYLYMLPARASEQGNVIRSVRIYISESAYVGLARVYHPLIQTSGYILAHFFCIRHHDIFF